MRGSKIFSNACCALFFVSSPSLRAVSSIADRLALQFLQLKSQSEKSTDKVNSVLFLKSQ